MLKDLFHPHSVRFGSKLGSSLIDDLTGDWVRRDLFPSAAPALQAHQKELEKHMRRDSLDSKLQKRPKPEDLINQGILEGS